jgi:hypothetical protein
MLKPFLWKRPTLALIIGCLLLGISSCGRSAETSAEGSFQNSMNSPECKEFATWYSKATSGTVPKPSSTSASVAMEEQAKLQEQWAKELEAIESSDKTFVDIKNRLVKQQRDFATLQRQQANAIATNNQDEGNRIRSVMQASVATVNQSVAELLKFCSQR